MATKATSTKHTPGPWRLFHKPGPVSDVIAIMSARKTNQHNEVVHWSGFDASHYPKQALANARLVAAAPDMLAALRAFVAVADADEDQDLWTDEYRSAVEDATAAIAKATAA